MKSYDYEAVVWSDMILCVECLPDEVKVDDEDVSPVFADSEWDHIPVCEECGREHDYMVLLPREMVVEVPGRVECIIRVRVQALTDEDAINQVWDILADGPSDKYDIEGPLEIDGDSFEEDDEHIWEVQDA